METKILLKKIADRLTVASSDIKYKSKDLCDSGNELGIVVGNIIKMMNEEQVEEFFSGIRHGISLTNGTH